MPGEGFTAREKVPAGYKIAARDLRKGEPILKYNVTVGFAASDIPAGTLLHSHNTEFREFDRDYAHAREYQPVALLPEAERATFQGIVREDGRVATRNYHRHPLHGELLGHGRARRGATGSRRSAWRISPMSTASSPSATRSAAAWR